MTKDDDSKEDKIGAKAPAGIDLDAISDQLGAAQAVLDAAGGAEAIAEQLSAAGGAFRNFRASEGVALRSESLARSFEHLTPALRLSSLVNDAAGLGTFSAARRIFEDYERQQQLLTSGLSESLARATLGIEASRLTTMGESLAMLGIHASASRTGEMMSLATGVPPFDLQRFDIPDLSAVGALSRDLEALIRPSFDIPALDIREMLIGLHTPWLDMSNLLGSAEALVRVQSLGLQLQQSTAFAPDYSDLLRSTLGDWRKVSALPDGLEEQSARSGFYAELGFDMRVVDRPDEAFDETLTLAGIAFAPEDNEIADRHDDAGLARARHLHAVIQQLEAEVRSFIVAVLTAEFGPQWYKHLPNNLHDEWLETQKRDPRGHMLAPIDYADFSDFERIICKKDLFRVVFAGHFASLDSARESLMRLAAPRNAAMHSRPIGRDDALLAAFEVRRLTLILRRK